MNNLLEQEDIKIEDMIYEIRGKQVMLDSDLAKLYKVETKRINEAVYRNIEKFPERFSWILNNEDWIFLRSQIATLENNNKCRGHYRKYLPRVFTEQGVAMLATILKSRIATQVSINIMDAFVAMRHLISANLLEQRYINNLVFKHDNDIKLLQESFDKLEEKKKINEIYFNGQIYDAYFKILEIFSCTKYKLVIIDSYADNTLLDIVRRLKVDVILITKEKNLLSKQDIEKYNMQYHNLTVIYNNTFHDRYFIIDNAKVYHCGASINRIGYKTFSITEIYDKEVFNSLLNKIYDLTKYIH